MATYLDNAGLETLWSRIKNEFFRIGDKVTPSNIQISSGDIIYWDSASPTGSGDNITFHQPKFLNLPASADRSKSVLGVTSGIPAWKTISSSLAWNGGNASSAPTITPTVLGTAGTAVTLPFATASANGVVSTGQQIFAGQKTFNSTVILGRAPTTINAYDAVSGVLRMYAKNDMRELSTGQDSLRIIDVMRFSEGRDTTWTKMLLIGWGVGAIDHTTDIAGKEVCLYYGTATDPILGTKLDVNGILTNVNSIQSTGGGVAAMGLADLSTSGGGGGSGTVKEIYIGSTLYPTNVDGQVTLPDYPVFTALSTSVANSYAVSATIGGVTKNITVSDMRTVLGLGGTPDTEGGVAILGTGGKIKLSQIPDAILGQVVYAGQVTSYTSSSIVGVTMSTSAKRMMETKKGYAANTLDGKTIRITTSDTSSVSCSTYTFSYSDCEGMYFLWGSGAIASGSDYREWASERFEVGDWCISNGDKWGKVDNTDAVTSVNGHTGPVTLTKSDVGLSNVDNVSIYSWDGRNASTGHTSNITHVGTIAYGTWQGTAIANSYVKSTANGQLLIGNGTTMDLLAKGSNGQYLKSGSSTLEWATFPAPTATWNESTSSNPTLTITDVGGSVTSATIPAARKVTVNNNDTYYSGIVTTGAQTFVGVKSFDSPIYANVSIAVWADLSSYQDRTPRQDVSIQAIDYPILGTEQSKRRGFSFYSYENSPSQTPPSTGIGDYAPMMFGVSGLDVGQGGGLFFTGSKNYTGTTYSNYWGINTFNPQYRLHINGSFGTNYDTMLAINSGNVGIGTPSPDSKLHVAGTAHITGDTVIDSTLSVNSTLNAKGNIYLGQQGNPTRLYLWTKDSSDNVAKSVLRFSESTSNLLIFGESTHSIGYTTDIHGYNIQFYYGVPTGQNYGTLGTTLDSNGILTNVNSIQSTGGGIAAMGIADLALSGGGGGSGTVQSLQVNNATPIIPNTDGKLSLDAALTSGTTNAVSLAIGGSTLNITQSTLRTSLGLGAAAYLGTTTSVTSGSGSLITSGGVYSNTVSALGTSGNNLTWTKGGTTNSITVPYATKASQDGDGAVITNTYLKLSGGALTGRLDATSFYVMKGNTIGTYEDVTVNGETTRNIYRLIRMAQGSAQSPSYGILINELNGGWYVNAETNNFLINVRGTNNNESTATAMASIASTGGLRSDGTSSDADTLYQTTLTLGNSLTKAATNNLSHYGRIVMYGQGTGPRKYAEIVPPTLSSNVTLTLPSSTGTLALTSDISTALTGYLPLTGGTVTTTGSTHMVFNVAQGRSLDINLNDLDSFNIIKTTNQWSFVKFHGKTSSTSVVEEFGAIGFNEKSGLQARLRNAADTAWAYFNILTAKDTNLAVTYDQTETTQVNSFELTVGDVPLLMGRIDESTINGLI